ncbi:protein kintoun-like [Saccostrea echinata]|uniref:protein kintoun-like n=1 Tax=Saccostrea echinata TaxID=191078 RepID=UPI002A7FB831|nr:protein kintoun-like [Saccostrea echinata]
MASKEKFEDLNLSSDEIKQIGEALKNEEFRKLFVEYAEEISNPENRKKYEEEITQMENERGMDVQFVHPKPGHCIKTSVDGNTKAFINICVNDKIDTPHSTPQVSNGRKGLHWQIPHAFSPPRDDIAKSGGKCKVFDVVFHPDTYRMGENPRFMKLVEDTAVEGIENQFGVKFDRKNLKPMKMKYKGVPVATVIRTRSNQATKKSSNEEPDSVLKNIPYPYDDKTSAEKSEEMREKLKNKKKEDGQKTKSQKAPEKKDGPAEPKYSIKHRSNIDMQEYRNAPDAKTSTRPNELEIRIELPLLDSANQVELDVFEKKLSLSSEKPAKYKLDLNLPYPVDDEQGSARFDKSKHCLIVTLPVLPLEQVEMPFSGARDVETQEEKNQEESLKLIEEIPQIDDLPDLKEIDDLEDTPTSPETKPLYSEPLNIPSAPKVAYRFPDFTFSQDTEAVSFVLKVWNVLQDSVSLTYLSSSSCQVQFLSRGSGGFPIHYRFIVKFEKGCDIVPEYCTSDVNEANVVLTILKAKKARRDWHMFYAGSSEDQLQEYLFVTEKNLLTELNQLTAETEQVTPESENTTSVVVTEMNKKKLAIKVKKNKQQHVKANQTSSSGSRTVTPLTDSEEEELASVDNGPPSADIQVVHDREVCNLQGILKQRTVSESSEDLTSSNSSCSPSSPREDLFGFKKSVKFNDRIDQTTFRSGASVTSMTTALKSKRRRNRKRDEKKSGRQRLNSGGSEGTSSGEELEPRQFVEEDEENTPNSDKQEVGIQEEAGTGNDPDSYKAQVKSQEDVLEGRSSEKETGDDDKISSDVLETSNIAMESVESKLVKNIKEKLSMAKSEHCGYSDDDDGEIEEKDVNGTNEEEVHVIVKDKPLDYRTNPTEIGNSKQSKFTEQLDKSSKLSAKQSGEDSGVESGLEGPGDSSEKSGDKIETSLSWEETSKADPVPLTQSKAPNVTDLTTQDHTTRCAFDFSNAIMFDLDVD